MADDDIATKGCTSCELIKPFAEFHKKKGGAYGLHSICKECNKSKAREWYRAHRERERETQRKYFRKNREALLKRFRRYQEENKVSLARKSLAYRRRNREAKRARDIAWKKANPEKVKMYRKVSEHRRRAQKLASGGAYTAEQIVELHKKQRGKCACCRTPIRKAYHIDHVIALSKGGGNEITNVQLLCRKCNVRKSAKHPVDFMQENGFLL